MKHGGHYEREAARAIGLGGELAVSHAGVGGFTFTIPCHGCGPQEVRLAKKFPADVLARKLHQAGWSTRGKVTCPSCLERAHHEKEEIKMAEGERTAAARKAHRAVIQWLEESFDEEAGGYKGGMSDAAVAKETGAAVEYVAKVREEFFGPLKEPGELAAIRAKIEELHEKADELIRDATAAASVIRNDAGTLKAELARIAKANGWRA